MDYLFRGKDKKNGDWLYGGYAYKAGDVERHYIVESREKGFGYREVDRESLGQCSGIHDDKGCMIFAGDIVKTSYNMEEGGVEYGLVENRGAEGFMLRVKEGHALPLAGIMLEVEYRSVVGNKWDNKEMLERLGLRQEARG